MEKIKDDIASFIDGLFFGVLFHFIVVLVIFVAYMVFVSRHWRTLLVVASIVLWAIIAARAAGFTM